MTSTEKAKITERIKVNEEVRQCSYSPGICMFINDAHKVNIRVVNEDCLVAAKNLQNPMVLVMASDKKPGGGVLTGARAQEEDIFRRTSLINIIPTIQPYYPLKDDDRGIYCFDVTVLRDTEENNYAIIEPYKIAAFIMPALDLRDPTNAFNYTDRTLKRIRTIFEAAKAYNHRNLVLGAFGCGVFQNDPWKMSLYFKEIIRREYGNCFDNITFACMCDEQNDRNYRVFKTNLENK